MAGQRLGQHFLNNRGILERLAAAVCPEPAPLVIEIGPGRGALTEFLVPRAERVVAVELDRILAPALRVRFSSVEVVEADVLETDLSQWGRASVAGNLPYYITSPILERIFAMGTLLDRAVVLIQREVADRLVARPGTRDYGYLSVITQFYSVPEMLFAVPPGAFSPPPKVDSAAVLLKPRPAPFADAQGFLTFAGRAFQHKRKTLRNNLRGFYPGVEQWPEAGLRAEQIGLEEMIALYVRTQDH